MTPSVPRSHSTAIAGPSRTADNKRKSAHAAVSIHSDDDSVQEVRTKSNKRTGGATVKRRRKEDDQDDPEDTREEVEDKRTRRRREELEEESVVEEVQEVVPPLGKKGRGDSRKPASRTGKGEPKVNGGSRGVTSTTATAKGKGKAKASRQDIAIDLEEVELVDLDEEGIRAEVEGIANAINSVQRSGKQATSRAMQVSRTERDDENSPLKEQLRQVCRLLSQKPICVLTLARQMPTLRT